MRLTVAICTWNRSALLRRTLASLAELRVPPGLEWEVLVVANACTDSTPAVAAAAATRLPLRLVHEPELGLSHARNRAVNEATGDYLLWIDDDVLVDREWLAAYVEAFAAYPEATFFGGPIRPWFENAPPEWLVDALPAIGNAFSLLDLGPEPVRFREHMIPFGANYAIRADAQRAHRYNPALGRRGTGMLSGEETAVVYAILREGGEGWWVPNAGVAHFVSPQRQTIRYLKHYYYYNGLAIAVHGLEQGSLTIFGRPSWVWKQAVRNEVFYRLARLMRPASVWAHHLSLAQGAWGMLNVPRRLTEKVGAEAARAGAAQ